jgi:hypothetical protein
LPKLEKLKVNEQTEMEMRRRIEIRTGDGALIIGRYRSTLPFGFYLGRSSIGSCCYIEWHDLSF